MAAIGTIHCTIVWTPSVVNSVGLPANLHRMLTRVASCRPDCWISPPASAIGGTAVDCCSSSLELYYIFAVRVYYSVCFVSLTSKRRYSASAALVAPPPCAWVCGRDAPWGGEKGLTNLFAVYRLHTRPRGRGLCGQ